MLLLQVDTISFASVALLIIYGFETLNFVGDKVYVDPNSIVGSVGVVAFSTFVKRAAEEDHKVKVKSVASRE